MAKQKRSKSIRGPATQAQSVLVLGGVELDLATRKQTGRVFLRPICNRRAETLKRVIQSYVVPGTAVWTDDFASYCFLTDLGYRPTTGTPFFIFSRFSLSREPLREYVLFLWGFQQIQAKLIEVRLKCKKSTF